MKSNGTLLNYCSFKEKLSLRILLSPEFCYGSLKHYQGFYYSHFTDKETELSILQVNGECSMFTLSLRHPPAPDYTTGNAKGLSVGHFTT